MNNLTTMYFDGSPVYRSMEKKFRLPLLVFGLILLYWTMPAVWGINSEASGDPDLIEETRTAEEGEHPSWWLHSGGKMLAEDSSWRTVYGNLEANDIWRRHYLRTNPLDTDNGFHPQNVFRLLSKESFDDPDQELHFIIKRTQLSPSPNRNESSGIFLYTRYINIDSYYFAGIQHDGKVVIKKKYGGIFETLAESQVFTGDTYERNENPTLLPHGKLIMLRSEAIESDGKLHIRVYLDIDRKGSELVLEAVDTGRQHGEILPPGKVGVRSDFMDILFTNYLSKELR